jgi:putative hydrolase of HD superfamily
MSELLQALLALVPLDRLPRTGWLQRGVAVPESLAGHSLGVAQVALALAPREEPPLDVDRVLALCLVHDAPEALTGDLPRSGSRHLPAGAKATAEAAAAAELLAPLHPLALERWAEYAAGETREARFARLCDRLQLGVRLLAYLRSGQRGLEDFVETVRGTDPGEFPAASAFHADLLAALEDASRAGSGPAR